MLDRTSDKVFKIDVNGISKFVSIENIKPAHFTRDDLITSNNSEKSIAANVPSQVTVSEASNDAIPIILNDTPSTSDVTPSINRSIIKVPPLKTYVNKKKVTFNFSNVDHSYARVKN